MAALPIPSRRLVVLLVITAVALMTIDVRGLGPLDRAREVTLTLTRPARDVVAWAMSPVVEGWRGAVHYDDLQDENAELRARVAELQGQVDRAPDAEAELAALLRATELAFVGDVERRVARVAVDRRSGLERVVELDKGSDDGVRAGMPVVTGTGLVGRLELVTPRRSVVRLLTDPTFDVGVRSSSGELGVARGDGAERPLVLELAAPGSSGDQAGERYATAGAEGSVFPPGIPVGQVVGGTAGDGVLRLEPLAELERLEYVTVLLWEPDR